MDNQPYFKHGDHVVYAIPGCASESLQSGKRVLPQRCIAFVRDSIERARSKFQFFFPFPKDERYAPTWEAWVDRLLRGDKDWHWLPQADLLKPVDAVVYPFEQLNAMLPGLRHINRSVPIAVDTSYRRAELLAYYAQDYELRTRCGVGSTH